MTIFLADVRLPAHERPDAQRATAVAEVQQALHIAGIQAEVSLQVINMTGVIQIDCPDTEVSIEQVRAAVGQCLQIDLLREEGDKEIALPGMIEDFEVED